MCRSGSAQLRSRAPCRARAREDAYEKGHRRSRHWSARLPAAYHKVLAAANQRFGRVGRPRSAAVRSRGIFCGHSWPARASEAAPRSPGAWLWSAIMQRPLRTPPAAQKSACSKSDGVCTWSSSTGIAGSIIFYSIKTLAMSVVKARAAVSIVRSRPQPVTGPDVRPPPLTLSTATTVTDTTSTATRRNDDAVRHDTNARYARRGGEARFCDHTTLSAPAIRHARSSHSSTMSSHIVGPDLVSSASPRLVSKSSAALRTVGGGPRHLSTSSVPHVPAPHQNRVEDLRHAHVRLDARPGFEHTLLVRQYRTPRFARQLLEILNALQVPSWSQSTINPEALVIRKVSGSLTNAVFFVSSSTSRTLLLRIYGPSSGELISRPRELHTLHILSSTYHLGPRVYGTFDNGRVEQYFESVTLTAADIRLPKISSYIGARMAELHCVDIAAIELAPAGASWQIGAEKNVNSWLPPARHVLALPSVRDSVRADLDLTRFQATWDAYMKWLRDYELKEGASKRVFCHNDAQYGNLLKLNHLKEDTPEHHQWTANYHGPTPHILDPTRYPTPEERRNFYRAYLTHCQPPLPSTSTAAFAALGDDARERELQLGAFDRDALRKVASPTGLEDVKRKLIARLRDVRRRAGTGSLYAPATSTTRANAAVPPGRSETYPPSTPGRNYTARPLPPAPRTAYAYPYPTATVTATAYAYGASPLSGASPHANTHARHPGSAQVPVPWQAGVYGPHWQAAGYPYPYPYPTLHSHSSSKMGYGCGEGVEGALCVLIELLDIAGAVAPLAKGMM
ncbi:hypothetical protein EVG20_g5659 [Dentipellis fragilis]|uniref:Choline kinase N-terminal domain-containing protein n=1 Tax=Dentipellis fragilis TaxID=205917 RepID=A0A4Y9YSA4_9AGAM|nr:hypothetical protein EVG20_g5659 [Dentipellis fragilis]